MGLPVRPAFVRGRASCAPYKDPSSRHFIGRGLRDCRPRDDVARGPIVEGIPVGARLTGHPLRYSACRKFVRLCRIEVKTRVVAKW